MRLHRLKLANFRQHAETDITLGDGITAIIGPNGVGKTTLLEAIAWAFYGTPAVRGTRDSIRWNRAPARSQVRVEVEFGLGGHEYTVTRTLYGAEMFEDHEPVPVANSQHEVTAAVRRLLRMSREEFFNTYFTGQKELAVMAAMGATERGKFLSRLLGYEKLRQAQDLLREARSGLRGELAGLERGLLDPDQLARERSQAEAMCQEVRQAVTESEQRLRAAQQQRDAEGPRWTEIVRRREEVQRLESDRRVADKEVIEARREFERLDRELAEALSAQDQLKEMQPALDELEPMLVEIKQLEREAVEADRRRTLAGQLAEARAQIERLGERRTALGDPDADLAVAEEALAAAQRAQEEEEKKEEEALTAYVRAKQDAETKMLGLRDQYRDLQAHLEGVEQAGPEGTCPTCARPLGGEYESVIEALGRQLEEVEMNGKFFRQRFDQLAEEPADVKDAKRRVHAAREGAQRASEASAGARARQREVRELGEEMRTAERRIKDLETEMAGLPETYDHERHDVVRERLRELEPLRTKATEFRIKAERAAQLVQEAETAEKGLSEREARVTELVTQIEALGYGEERYEAARVAYEEAEAAVHEAELTRAERRGDLQTVEAAVAAAIRRQEEREERVGRATSVRRDLLVHDELDTAFGDLRTELNAQLRPELAEVASVFLADLTDGRYHELELDEQYRVMILEEGVAKPVISGGEEDVANLVLRLAISQMVAERAGQPFSLLVLDEIFGSLDDSRRQHVVGLLRHLADRFPQVVLITHIESVRDAVDRVLRVAVDAARGAAVVSEDAGGLDEDVAA